MDEIQLRTMYRNRSITGDLPGELELQVEVPVHRSVEEYIYTTVNKRVTIDTKVKQIPQRLGRFCSSKIKRLGRCFVKNDKAEEGGSSSTSDIDIFLELETTFDPPKESALLYYFQSLNAQKGLGIVVEFERIEALLEGGANINARDNAGQTILHDACREAVLETITFLIEKGSAINVYDKHGRTPLHIAAAYDNHKIISYLIKMKADYGALTHGDIQTPLHYAAKNDAPAACTVLIENKANIEARDYRGRTPLLIAAELDRSVAASALLDHGASARVLDYTGYHSITAMVTNMPAVAMKALDQCYEINRTSRQEFFWLNYLEPSLIESVSNDSPCRGVLEEIVMMKNQDLIKHPVIVELINTKWCQFGLSGCLFDLVQYVMSLLAWSLLVINIPFDISPASGFKGDKFWNTFVEIACVVFYMAQLLEEILETKNGYIEHREWRAWKIKQAKTDLKFVLPKAVEEKDYLEGVVTEVEGSTSPYLADYWNIYDWVNMTLFGIALILYFVDKFGDNVSSKDWALGTYKSILWAFVLTLAWFKMFKYVRVFEALGPFVVIITNSIGDIAKMTFVYFVLYIPMVCVFFQFWGKSGIDQYSDILSTMFTVFRMIVVDDYGYDSMIEWGDEVHLSYRWTHIIVAYWLLASSIILLNLFIALMSDTFQRVYDKAVEVAALERAQTIVCLEKKLSFYKRKKFLKYIKKHFSPKILYTKEEVIHGDGAAGDEKNVRSLAKDISDEIKEVSELMNTETAEDNQSNDYMDFKTQVKDGFEEQEIALRNALARMKSSS